MNKVIRRVLISIVLTTFILIIHRANTYAQDISTDTSESLALYSEDRITGGIHTGSVYVYGGSIEGGTFKGKVNFENGNITGGTFENGVEIGGTVTNGIFNCPVRVAGSEATLSGGTYNGQVNLGEGTQITGGTYNGEIFSSFGNITDGYFKGYVNFSGGTISGGIFEYLQVVGTSSGTTVKNCTVQNNQFGVIQTPWNYYPTVTNITFKDTIYIGLEGLQESHYQGVFSAESDGKLYVNLSSNPLRVMTIEKIRTGAFDKVNIAFNPNGGSGTMSDTYAYRQGMFRLPKNTFTKTGTTFKGWKMEGKTDLFEDEADIINCTILGNAGESITLYAQWADGSSEENNISRGDETSADITVSDNKPMNYSVETKGEYKISYAHTIPFWGKSRINAASFGDLTVSSSNASYKVKKVKINKKKHLIQITDLQGADRATVKAVKKATKGENGLKFSVNPYYVRNTDIVTVKTKKDGLVKSAKVSISGKDYKVKKSEWSYESASRTITFKGDNLAGSYQLP